MTKRELAIALHDRKFNCCQSVACAFAQEAGIAVPTLFRAAEGFGLGMGCMEGTCGALSAAVLLAGFVNSDGNIDAPGTKASTYQLTRKLVQTFRERTGSTVCGELKGLETGKMLCSCPDCIRTGVDLVQEILNL